MASPPVTRLLDYGQFKYEQARREKEARRHQRSVEFKEIRLKAKIGKGDFDTKVRRAIEFLEDGDRVKVTVQFRGREVSHAYLGRDLLIRFAEQVGEHGTVERQPLLEGKSMSLVMASTHKPKTPQTSRSREGGAAGATPIAKRPARHRRPHPARRRTGRATRSAGRRLKDEPMPKMKTHKGAQKRFGVTGSGKIPARQGVARPPPRDQVVPPHPALRGQGRRRLRPAPSRSDACCPYL